MKKDNALAHIIDSYYRVLSVYDAHWYDNDGNVKGIGAKVVIRSDDGEVSFRMEEKQVRRLITALHRSLGDLD